MRILIGLFLVFNCFAADIDANRINSEMDTIRNYAQNPKVYQVKEKSPVPDFKEKRIQENSVADQNKRIDKLEGEILDLEREFLSDTISNSMAAPVREKSKALKRER